jgi:signal transduction histidine kinase
VVLIGIAVLLIALALLQYRLDTQIRQTTEILFGADLESLMMKWHLDLYGEFSTICIALQVGPDSGARDTWQDYLHRYQDWRQAAINSSFAENIYSNPDVVSDIYIFQASRGGNAPLLRLNAHAGAIERAGKPAELQDLLSHLQRNSSNLKTALRAWEGADSFYTGGRKAQMESLPAHKLRTNAITGWQFEESIPAIVHPILHHRRIPHYGTRGSDADAPVDWVVIVLNQDTIRHRIFPQLAQRYFAGGQGLEYKLAVIALGKTSRLLYSSDPEFGIRNVKQSDSVMNIFGPPPESTEGSLLQVVTNIGSVRGQEWHSFSGPVWFPVIETSDPEPWMLFLQHRAAPVEASITKVWRENLLVGGFVLLLLATSMMLVLIATQRVRALAKLQMDFVASISHELRTPLAAMLSVGQNLRDGFVPDLSRYGSIITARTRQLIELVDQILLFASTKDKKKTYHLTAVDPHEVLQSLRESTLATLAEAGFDVDFCVPQGLPHVLADRQALVRCLQNLIDNAAKYSGGNQWIKVCAEVDQSPDVGPEVKISISDHGVGINSSELQHIFEPFYRGPRAVVGQIHGTGLGLAVVEQIMTAMEGRVSVLSDIGIGSVFTLHLQLAAQFHEFKTIQSQQAVT